MSAKDAYEQKIQARLEELDAEIDKLKAKAKAADAEAQLEYTRQLSQLRELREDAGRKMERLGAASDDALDEARAGLENAWNDLKRAMERAKSRFD